MADKKLLDKSKEMAYEILRNFHASYGAELIAQRHRIEELIGDDHWLSVGNYKESLLRRLFRERMPKSFEVGNGFVALRNGDKIIKSDQIDILIWDSLNSIPLFRDGEFVVIAPEACLAAIEVKGNLDYRNLRSAIKNLERVTSLIRLVNKMKSANFAAPFRAVFAFKMENKIKWPKYVFESLWKHYQVGDKDYPWSIKDRILGRDGMNHERSHFPWIEMIGVLDTGFIERQSWFINKTSIVEVYSAIKSAKNGDAFSALFNGLSRVLLAVDRNMEYRNPGISSLLIGNGKRSSAFMRLNESRDEIRSIGILPRWAVAKIRKAEYFPSGTTKAKKKKSAQGN
jgi:hypothetical protein